MRRSLLVFLLLMALHSVALGQAVKVYEGKSTRVTDKHFAPKLGSSTYAYAKYTFEATLKDGTRIYWSARLHNFGMSKGQAEAKSRVHVKGEAKPRRAKEELKKGQYALGSSPVKASFGDHEMAGTVRAIELRAKGDNYSFDLVFTPRVKGWRPGGGKVKFPDGTAFDATLLQPKSRVKGTVTIDGEVREVSGYGYATYTRSSAAPHDQAKRYIEFRTIDGKTVVWMKEFITSKKFGEKTARYLLVAHKGKIVVATTDFEMEYGGWKEDGKSKKKYKNPTSLIIRAKDGGTNLVLAIKASKLKKRRDELAKLNVAERMVVGRFAQPIHYSYKAQFEINATGDNTFTGKGKRAIYDVYQLNP
jgi:hypothetical protein